MKYSREVLRAISQVKRPMGWESAEQIAKKHTGRILTLHNKLVQEVYQQIRIISKNEFPSFQTMIQRERNKNLENRIKGPSCSCGNKNHEVEKARRDIRESDIPSLIAQLSQYLRPDQIESLEDIFDRYSDDFFSSDNPGDTAGAVNRLYQDTFIDGFQRSFENLNAASKTPEAVAFFREFEPLGFDPTNAFIADFYNVGFRLVTSKLSFAAKGLVFEVMVEGLGNGDTWNKIAENVHRLFGAGYRYHWERLIRTEMTGAYYESFKQQYGAAQVPIMKLSLSIGACPICVGLEGYYRRESEPPIPQSTHPNCRCIYIPYFRLPRGAKLKA